MKVKKKTARSQRVVFFFGYKNSGSSDRMTSVSEGDSPSYTAVINRTPQNNGNVKHSVDTNEHTPEQQRVIDFFRQEIYN